MRVLPTLLQLLPHAMVTAGAAAIWSLKAYVGDVIVHESLAAPRSTEGDTDGLGFDEPVDTFPLLPRRRCCVPATGWLPPADRPAIGDARAEARAMAPEGWVLPAWKLLVSSCWWSRSFRASA